jgi:hypothetical protein
VITLSRSQAVADRLHRGHVVDRGERVIQDQARLRKWLARLPHPFTPADRAAGYRYDVSIL